MREFFDSSRQLAVVEASEASEAYGAETDETVDSAA